METDNPKKPPTPKKTKGIKRGFLAKKMILEDLQHAPGIVGGIVEKGFSSSAQPRRNPSFPQPSVVPFPVARHRSHGPHSGPGSTERTVDEEEVEEDKDETDYDPVSRFANPIQKKEKKGLDFSRWREFVPKDGDNGCPAPKPKEKQAKTNKGDETKEGDLPVATSHGKETSPRSSAAAKAVQKPDRNGVEPETSEPPNGNGLPSPVDGIDVENGARFEEISPGDTAETKSESTGKMDSGMLEMLKKRGMDKLGSKVEERKGERVLESVGQGSQSPMDDIDAENLTRIKQMSVDEIEEAQAEIMEKVNPSVVEMLKRRGQNKLRTKNASASSRDMRQKDLETGKRIEGGRGSKLTASARTELSKTETNSNLWKSWSERVEEVRLLRFSLDGNVVDIDSTNGHPNGNKPDDSQYNVENVAERDFLRTEGDPAAVGYTIKEATALIRSLVPGQRSYALHLLASIFKKALHNLQKKDVQHVIRNANLKEPVDWQAVWAYALGPEPEMALSLRIALDDNHGSVVLACAKAIQCILSYDINENFFDINEKLPTHVKDICIAPVFRSRPEADGGFLHGGFWKYNTKPSNILLCNDEDEDEDNAGNHTIQDDVVVAEQDVAAGLVRMGILPRICYLLEMDPVPTLEDCLVSILIALARHSPTCANAIIRCPRLVETVSNMLTKPETMEIHSPRLKAVVLLKVLSESDRQICSDFVNRGMFHRAMWHWYRNAYTLEHWIKSGKEHCKLTSAMMVEQLRLWRVCIRYGYCITNFTDFFPAMCLWLNPPAFEKLTENDVLCEFASIAREAYLVMEALSQTLPILHLVEQLQKKSIADDNIEAWCWSHVSPMVDIAINWLSLESIPYLSMLNGGLEGIANHGLDPSLSSMLWVISAVLSMLSSIVGRIAPENFNGMYNAASRLPWLPQFVPKIGLEITKNGFLNFLDLETKGDEFSNKCGSLVDALCYLRHRNDHDASLASVSCLHGLVRLALLVDNSVQRTRIPNSIQPKVYRPEPADKILVDGITKSAKNDLLRVLSVFTTFVSSEWHVAHSVEMFGRGGPAPGIGFGWGSPGGGFWSLSVLLARVDAQLIVNLLEIFILFLEKDRAFVEGLQISTKGCGEDVTMQRINAILSVCLIAGPGDIGTLEKALDVLFQAPILKYLSFCTLYFLQCNKGLKPFDWQYEEEEYHLFSKILNSHFKNRWLSVKKKSPGEVDRENQIHAVSEKGAALITIHEDLEISETTTKCPDCISLLTEWAHQRLPLPNHWFLSCVCSISDMRVTGMHAPFDILDVGKAGLFFLLGLEAMSSLQCYGFQNSPISVVPLVWKLHALSMALHATMDVLKEEKSREIFETLQELYGQQLDKLRLIDIDASTVKNQSFPFSAASVSDSEGRGVVNILNFQAQVYGSYPTFVEDFIEQFAAVSYGDILFGRQVMVYLHCSVDKAVRLATWNALSNAHALELLPSAEKCLAQCEGYLEPTEHDEGILEAYVKSWSSGALDRAASRKCFTFTLAQHHLSCFIFSSNSSDKLALWTKLTKPLLRSYSRKQHQEGMLLDLVKYKLPVSEELKKFEIERRFELLQQACEGDSSLLATVKNLKAFVYSCLSIAVTLKVWQ